MFYITINATRENYYAKDPQTYITLQEKSVIILTIGEIMTTGIQKDQTVSNYI